MMADSNNEKMAVKEEVEHTSDFTDQDTTGEHVVIKTDTFAVAEAALGEHLPQHYYRSIGFIGTVAVSTVRPDKATAADPHRHYVLVTSATI
jgi:hypothetical protein